MGDGSSVARDLKAVAEISENEPIAIVCRL